MKYVLLSLILAISISCSGKAKPPMIKNITSDSYIRERVYQLRSDTGGCTGVQVQALSGKMYILTAGHCRILLVDGKVAAVNDQGKSFIVSMVDLAVDKDLMLLSIAENIDGVRISDKLFKYEKIHTLTHGLEMPTYRTDGEVIGEKEALHINIFAEEKEEFAKCRLSPNRVISMFSIPSVCEIRLISTISTALVLPGSSGGPVLNEKGELIGIVSNTDGFFSGLVPLHDIKDFLRSR